ncbi:MAG TPA: aminotransferase class III-fold pyridoxal phosphate-dependent enzyme [Pyrinomonadaceae bacterium]|nr:aminotransferase class III-fold pyridoxal phosphate-dependent enzyme [Pyrinomonadaceae bacterium]
MKNAGQHLYKKAKAKIPGGTQLLSKRPEMFLPEQWPSYFSKASGVEVWDVGGNKYLDMSYNGIGSCVLGAADPDVDAAVRAAIDAGTMSTLNCPEEVELADLLCELHPWADMVRYGRCGGEAMAIAVRIARARTGRELVAFCGYHGWHDWYLAANLSDDAALDGHLLPGLEPAGVPRSLKGTSLPFRYNQIDELKNIVAKHGDELAAIVMEPIREHEPQNNFLEQVRELADETGAVFILDEVTSGFRMNSGGAHLLYDLTPDIAVFAKAIGNGYPMAAIIGCGDVMEAAQKSFISSTYWTERIGPTAALATIRKHQRCDVGTHLVKMGRAVKRGWQDAAGEVGLDVHVGGLDPLAHFAIQVEDAQAAHSLFTQCMLDRGFLASKSFYATFAHNDENVSAYLEAAAEVFSIIAEASRDKSLVSQLRGPVAHSGFHRLT